MAIVRIDYDWTHTANMLAMIYNRTRFGKNQPAKKVASFMPKTGGKGEEKTKLSADNIVGAFE